MKRRKEGNENRTYYIFLHRLEGIFQDMSCTVKPRTNEGTYEATILSSKLMNSYELAKLGQIAKLSNLKEADENEGNYCYQYSYTILSDENVPDDLPFISPSIIEGKELSGTCVIYGCTDNACIHADEGPCWWIDNEHTLCSHCLNHFGETSVERPADRKSHI